MATIRAFIRGLLVVLVLGASEVPARAAAQEGIRLVEHDIKAGLLYNFLRYTQWPAATGSNSRLVVCLYGGDPFGGRLAPMAGRTVNQRTIELRAVGADRDLDQCALVFINAAERADWPRLRTYLARRSILTVSDYQGFARSGGMLEFTRINNRIGVSLNVDAAQAANLTVQERLLRLANVVRTDAP
jgi:hypothetical protein